MNDTLRSSPPLATEPRRWQLVWLWLAAGAMLVATLGLEPVRRSQEARVLVTAREMLGAPLQHWLVPRCNGEVRLRKPPLAYWASAASFAALGVNEFNGRLPMALAGWLMVGLTYFVGRWTFGARAGLFAAAVLCTCMGFLNYMRLAETDALPALFVTAAVYATWRGYAKFTTADDVPARRARSACWFVAAGVASGLAVMGKGPPGAYPFLFLLVLGAIERRWRAIGWGIACSLPAALVVAAPWFAYVLSQPSAAQIAADFKNSAGGGKGHHEWFFEYFPRLLALAAPWSGLLGLALAFAAWERRDPRVRGLIIWVLVILVPLCLWGNKQPHYLLPILPPLMVLIGALVDRGLFGTDQRLRGWTRGVLVATVVVVALAALVVPAIARSVRGKITPADVALAGGTAAWALVALWLYRAGRASRALTVATLGCALTVAAIVAWWEPTLEDESPRAVADALRAAHGNGPYAFWGAAESLPLCFELRTIIPRFTQPEQVARHIARYPDCVLIEATSRNAEPTRPPPSYRVVERFTSGERQFVIFRRDAGGAGSLTSP